MSFRAISLDDPDGWHRALSRLPHGFGHTWEACRAAWLTRPGPTWLFVWEDPAGGSAAAPFVERPTPGGAVDITVPFGFAGFIGTGPVGGLVEAWTEFARARGYVCGYQALHPAFRHDGLHRPDVGYSDNSLYLVDLTRGEEALRAGLDQNRRRQLRAWPSRGRTVDDREALTDFLVAHARPFLERAGASPATLLDEASLRLLGGSGSTLLLGSARGGSVVSAHLFGVTPWAADALMHISVPEGREDTAVMVWAGVERLLERGIASLNLGGGVREDDSIARAKQRFGAARVPLVRVKEVYDRDRFREECRRAGVDPDDRTGYFPPYRSPGRASGGRRAPRSHRSRSLT